MDCHEIWYGHSPGWIITASFSFPLAPPSRHKVLFHHTSQDTGQFSLSQLFKWNNLRESEVHTIPKHTKHIHPVTRGRKNTMLLKWSQTTVICNCCTVIHISFFCGIFERTFCSLCLKSMCIFFVFVTTYLLSASDLQSGLCLANALTSTLEWFLNPNKCGDIIPTWHSGSPAWTCTITIWQGVGRNAAHVRIGAIWQKCLIHIRSRATLSETTPVSFREWTGGRFTSFKNRIKTFEGHHFLFPSQNWSTT